MKFRLKLCSPYLSCLFEYIHFNSEWDVKCTNSQIPSFVYIFCFLIEKIAREKKPPMSLVEYIYGSTGFFGSAQKMLSKEANNFDVFYVQYIERQVVLH